MVGTSSKTTFTPRRAFRRLGGDDGSHPSVSGRSSTAGPLLRQRHKVDRIDLQFRDLTVALPGGRRKVLNGVTGGFRSGKVTAVMGPSGCGKTTLISALSNRLGLGTRVTGSTFINGTSESSTALHDVMGFVPQDDIMYEDLTVKENLLFCCQLRADPSMSRAEQRRHVDRVIDSLGLFPSRHSMIGSTEDRGISGGQRKRVNVAMELTSKPLLLFLDEPTSGLVSICIVLPIFAPLP
jgi:ABC-type multidrug transport system ATPase subunit